MKIALIQPPTDAYMESGMHRALAPSLGLLAVCAGIPRRHTVSVLNLYTPSDRNKLARNKYDIVGISCLAMERDNAVAVARELKARYAPVVVVGGIHATLVPEDLLKEGAIDYVVRGAGDESFPRLIEFIESGRCGRPDIAGVCCRRGRAPHIAAPAVITDLDRLPLPRYEAIDLKEYLKRTGGELSYEASRGCVHRCLYCSMWKMYNRIYPRSVEKVVEDLGRIAALSPAVTRIRFVDNTFNFSRDRMLAIAAGMRRISARAGRKITWTCLMRPENIDGNLVGKLKQGGLARVYLGFETANDRSLVRLRKGRSVAAMVKAADCFIRRGVATQMAFQLGFPWETAEEMWNSVRLALELERKGADTVLYKSTPLPGTDIARQVKARFRGRSAKFSIFPPDIKGLCFKHPTVSAQLIDKMMQSYLNGKKLSFLVNRSLKRQPGTTDS